MLDVVNVSEDVEDSHLQFGAKIDHGPLLIEIPGSLADVVK